MSSHRITQSRNSLFNALSHNESVDEEKLARVKSRGKLLLQKSIQAPAPMKDTFYFSIYQNNEDQIRIYADELKITPSALSLQNAYHPGSNGPFEVEDYLTDKQLQQQTIGLFGKEISDEINEFLQQKTGITIQD